MATRVRVPLAAGLAAGLAAALAVGQVALAELAGITTLDAEFTAGNERVQGVQVTLLTWYAAVAVTVAIAVAVRQAPVTADRVAVVPAAGLGALAGAPVAAAFSGRMLADDVWPAVVAGALLGAAAALAVLAIPAAGSGVAAHAGLLWLAALTLTPLVPRTVTYAGIVEPLGLALPRGLRSAIRGIPVLDRYSYHLPWMLPAGIAVVLLSAVLAVRTVSRTGSPGPGVAAGVAGPLLAAASYRVGPDALFLWNEDASFIVLLIAGCCALAAAVGAFVSGRRVAAGIPAA